jgi:hypothetical protein
VRLRSLGIVLVVGLSVSACSSVDSTTLTTQAPEPAGTLPSPISRQICSQEARTELASALGETAHVSTPTWSDHLYSCTYSYPTSTPSGAYTVSVKELSSWQQTYAYFDSLAAAQGKSRNLEALGQAAFQTTNGSVVVRKDWKVLVVDNSGLPAQFGVPPTSSGAVAVTVADVILGCWAGD